jgi:hypothetical protein
MLGFHHLLLKLGLVAITFAMSLIASPRYLSIAVLLTCLGRSVLCLTEPRTAADVAAAILTATIKLTLAVTFIEPTIQIIPGDW